MARNQALGIYKYNIIIIIMQILHELCSYNFRCPCDECETGVQKNDDRKTHKRFFCRPKGVYHMGGLIHRRSLILSYSNIWAI